MLPAGGMYTCMQLYVHTPPGLSTVRSMDVDGRRLIIQRVRLLLDDVWSTYISSTSVSCRMLRACCILLSYIRISELLAGHYMLLICFLTGDLFLHILSAKGIIKTLGIKIANRAAVFSITEKHVFWVSHCAAFQGHLDICLLTVNFFVYLFFCSSCLSHTAYTVG